MVVSAILSALSENQYIPPLRTMCGYALLIGISSIAFAQQDGRVGTPTTGSYEGDIVDGQRHGQGTLHLSDGSVYVGAFEANLYHGPGKLTFADGTVYDGSFVAGKREGHGILRQPSGDTYIGLFADNQIDGRGVFTWANSGERYEGFFLNGQRHGWGEYTWPDGRRYLGLFFNNQLEGKAEYFWPDGSIYRGYFAEGTRHGDGVFLSAEGRVTFERYNQGELVSRTPVVEVPHCQLELRNHRWMFQGDDCINGLAHGTGLAVRLDGLEYVTNGNFVLGVLNSGVITSLKSLVQE